MRSGVIITALQLALLTLGLSGCGSLKSERRIGFDSKEIEAHRIDGASEIRVSGSATGPSGPYAQLDVDLEIGPTGRVVSARVARNGNRYGADPAAALQAVRMWRFRPFEFEGAAVVAVGSVQISYHGPEDWANRNASFPVVDRDRLAIVLERTGCYGNCPHYRVEIKGDGTASFETPDQEDKWTPRLSPLGVLVSGRHVSRIGKAELDGLVERFRSARFFGLKDRYEADITDGPYYSLTLRVGGRSKTVVDYLGRHVGMPAVVTGLEEEVDRVAGTARWIRGDRGTVAVLAAERFDFSSPAAAKMLFWAIADGDERFVLGLLERVPLEQILREENERPRTLGIALVEQSLRFERKAAFSELRRRGWLARLPKSMLGRFFADSAAGCDPDVATMLVETGADPVSRDAEGKTALISAVGWFGGCSGLAPSPRREIVSQLIRLGVPVGAVDAEGNSALHSVQDHELVRLLISAGARVDQRNNAGATPLCAVGDDRAALTLLKHGASPRCRDSEKQGLREIAGNYGMVGTLAWLDKHRRL
ncbi:MAG: DUF6438 domain-containing protein [Allosphingosinicella sp.]